MEGWGVGRTILGMRPPIEAEVVIIDGCGTGFTFGRMSMSKTLSYLKKTAAPAEIMAENIDVCEHVAIDFIPGRLFGCLPEDSGSAVFAVKDEGLVFVGLLVRFFHGRLNSSMNPGGFNSRSRRVQQLTSRPAAHVASSRHAAPFTPQERLNWSIMNWVTWKPSWKDASGPDISRAYAR